MHITVLPLVFIFKKRLKNGIKPLRFKNVMTNHIFVDVLFVTDHLIIWYLGEGELYSVSNIETVTGKSPF